ncbi:unnamed protein product [Kluyveromyces dobzhanskii CBS 2104]|uniref:WGS project CCBQ000000000 data, contig 00011 n=1 Tax=Kluyveromyces dobzhanskii CBS 2104 TaxID=1427455 RepID=A0A0A8L7K7_9SACH|nr:unnamed protein product [Kluyveromyces dobzhanskii CBS 2104]
MVFASATVLVSASLGALYLYQNKLVYPSWAQGARDRVDTPDMYGLPYEDLRLKTSDGELLEAFDIRNENSTATILVLCPNAGNIGYFLPVAKFLYDEFKMSVFLYSYRGYGLSTGFPSEMGLKIDADTVMDHLAHSEFHKSQKLVLYGRSLGGANSIYLARKYTDMCDAVILENTFLSIRKVIPYVFPLLKHVSFMCHEVWDSEHEIENIQDENLPFLFLAGLRDEIVPPPHMRLLYKLCPSRFKRFVEFPLGSHNDTIIQDGYWVVVREFLQKHNLI